MVPGPAVWPAGPAAPRAAQLGAALEDLERSLAAYPSAEDFIEQGLILHDLHHYREAVAAYDAAALRPREVEIYRSRPKPSWPCTATTGATAALTCTWPAAADRARTSTGIRGRLRARLRQFREALVDYSAALALQPDSATHAARGWIFLAHEVVPLALQDFEKALQLDTKNAEAYAGRGLIRARQGQSAAALADAEAACGKAVPSRRRSSGTRPTCLPSCRPPRCGRRGRIGSDGAKTRPLSRACPGSASPRP